MHLATFPAFPPASTLFSWGCGPLRREAAPEAAGVSALRREIHSVAPYATTWHPPHTANPGASPHLESGIAQNSAFHCDALDAPRAPVVRVQGHSKYFGLQKPGMPLNSNHMRVRVRVCGVCVCVCVCACVVVCVWWAGWGLEAPLRLMQKGRVVCACACACVHAHTSCVVEYYVSPPSPHAARLPRVSV